MAKISTLTAGPYIHSGCNGLSASAAPRSASLWTEMPTEPFWLTKSGEIVDGDAMLAIAAQERLQKGTLPHRTIVATVMSNLGLEMALRQMDGRLVRTPVGDRYVVEEMLRGGYRIGGEQSGHLIFLDVNTTGDGLVTCLSLLAILVQRQQPLSALRQLVRRYPQTLINVRVRERQDLRTIAPVSQVIRHVTD